MSGSTYDAVPYPWISTAATHVRRLETLGTLFGLKPAPIDRCRVLELGVASGANLIPQADELRDSRFVGIDLSPAQIERGKTIATAIGLANIDLRAADVLTIDDSWGQFDYIICHGLFSWAPAAVREAILRVCRRNLSPQGVALVSYNTLPGWRLRGMVREMMRYHVAEMPDREKAGQAVAMLDFLAAMHAQTGQGDTAAARAVQEERELIRQIAEPAIVYHEQLADENTPLYFHEFMAQAADAGLQFLAEAAPARMSLDSLPEQARQALRQLPIVRGQQYLDFIRGARFRATLLCHREAAVDRDPPPQRIAEWHVAFAAPPPPLHLDPQTDLPQQVRLQRSSLAVSDRAMKAVLLRLERAFPAFLPLGELLPIARDADASDAGPRMNLQVAQDILAGYFAEAFDLAIHPPGCTATPGDRPQTTQLARLLATEGNRVTNLRHEIVLLNPVQRALLMRLDGRHDRTELAAALKNPQAADSPLVLDGRPLSSGDAAGIERLVRIALDELARLGLLVDRRAAPRVSP